MMMKVSGLVLSNLRFFGLFFVVFIGFTFFQQSFSLMAQPPILKAIEYSELDGWSKADQSASFKAFAISCLQMLDDNRAFSKNPKFGGEYSDWQDVCRAAKKLGNDVSTESARHFFENHFQAFKTADPELTNGLFTGYFEPEVSGSLTKTEQYNIPVYARPSDLILFDQVQKNKTGLGFGRLKNNVATPYFTRKEIESGILENQNLELLWLKSRADRFFLQVQGSGRVLLENGEIIRLAYAGKTGLPYTAIGAVLIEQGELERNIVSMQTIRKWMDDNPEKAQELMWHNKSFVFFRRLEGVSPQMGPVGAQLVNLTPNISLAVDRRYWAFGTPIWLDLNFDPKKANVTENWRSLTIAQDTGSAIRGYARGDVFWGSGETAGQIAGRMKSSGNMVVLLPKKLAAKLKL